MFSDVYHSSAMLPARLRYRRRRRRSYPVNPARSAMWDGRQSAGQPGGGGGGCVEKWGDAAAGKAGARRARGRDELPASGGGWGSGFLSVRFEGEAEREFRRGVIGGYVDGCSGEEPVPAGFLNPSRPE